jgi:hypothetical protein
VVISISSGSWAVNICKDSYRNLEELDRVALKGEEGSGVDEWGKQCGGYWFLWSLYVFGCISIIM